MTKRVLCVFVLALVVVSFGVAQVAAEKIDTIMISKIKDEGLNRSPGHGFYEHLHDVYGPRLAGSPDFKEAAAWVSQKLTSWGLQNVHFEKSAPFAEGWTLKRFYLGALQPKGFPITAFPKAWSPGIKGPGSAEAIYLTAKNDEELNAYKGRLKGKFGPITPVRDVAAHFEAEGRRLTDADLLKLANAGLPEAGGGRRGQFFGQMNPAARDSMMRAMIKQQMPDADEATITRNSSLSAQKHRRWDPRNSSSARMRELWSCSMPGAVTEAPFLFSKRQFRSLRSRHNPPAVSLLSASTPTMRKPRRLFRRLRWLRTRYNRIARMLQKGQKVKLEMALDVAWTPADSSFNIVAEIPGTDLKDQIVMLVATSIHGMPETGATDDGTGVGMAVEAMRILQTLGVVLCRTIRMALGG